MGLDSRSELRSSPRSLSPTSSVDSSPEVGTQLHPLSVDPPELPRASESPFLSRPPQLMSLTVTPSIPLSALLNPQSPLARSRSSSVTVNRCPTRSSVAAVVSSDAGIDVCLPTDSVRDASDYPIASPIPGPLSPFDRFDPPFSCVDPSTLSLSLHDYPQPPSDMLDFGVFFEASDSFVFPE